MESNPLHLLYSTSIWLWCLSRGIFHPTKWCNYELCPFPPSLVEARYIMCKADKPQLADLINVASMLFHIKLQCYFGFGAWNWPVRFGTRVMHTIQSQMRTLHSLLETVEQLSWWTIDQWQHLPMRKTEWDAQNRRCQGRTVIHRNKWSVLEHNPRQGGLDKVAFWLVMPKWM